MRRDTDRERRFLRTAGPLAPGFADHACGRLAAGEVEYGDSWATRGVAELLAEMLEEAADIGAWAVLADQALDQRVDLGDAERDSIAERVFDAARKAAWAWARIAQARSLLDSIDREASR